MPSVASSELVSWSTAKWRKDQDERPVERQGQHQGWLRWLQHDLDVLGALESNPNHDQQTKTSIDLIKALLKSLEHHLPYTLRPKYPPDPEVLPTELKEAYGKKASEAIKTEYVNAMKSLNAIRKFSSSLSTKN
jgi:hypothetical protein